MLAIHRNSWAALAVAAGHGIEPVHADVAALPFDDATFDVVVAGEVLEHVTDLDGVVAEACRVLKPGGTFVCDTIHTVSPARLSTNGSASSSSDNRRGPRGRRSSTVAMPSSVSRSPNGYARSSSSVAVIVPSAASITG